MSALVPPTGLADAMRQFRANAIWAQEHPQELEAHLNQFVAVAAGRVLESALDEDELRAKYRSRPDVYIAFVEPAGATWVL